MSKKSTLIYLFTISIGAVEYECELSLDKGKYTFTISRITGEDKKGNNQLDKIHSSEYYFKPDRKQSRKAAMIITEPDAKKHQPEEEEITEVHVPKKERKPLAV